MDPSTFSFIGPGFLNQDPPMYIIVRSTPQVTIVGILQQVKPYTEELGDWKL